MRAPCGESDQQAFRARRVTGGRLRLKVETREALFGRSEALVYAALLIDNAAHHFGCALGVAVFKSSDRFGQWRR